MNLRTLRILLLSICWSLSQSLQAYDEQRQFIVYDASNGLVDNSAQNVMCTKTGRIVVTTLGHVNFFEGYSFNHVDPHRGDMAPLRGYRGKSEIYFDRFHHLWLKHSQSLSCVNLLTEQFISDMDGVFREMGMEERKVDNIFGDSDNNVWFLSGDTLHCPALGKVVRVDNAPGLQKVDVFRDSLLLLFDVDGRVAVSDLRTGRPLYADRAFDDSSQNRYSEITALCVYRGDFYVVYGGTEKSALMRYDVEGRRWSRLLDLPFMMSAICPYIAGNQLYIGAASGYIIYDVASGEHSHVETIHLTKGRELRTSVTSVAFDLQSGLWICTSDRGLLYSKPYPSPFQSLPIDSPEGRHYMELMNQRLAATASAQLAPGANCELTDSRGWKWTGTNIGLQLEKPDGETVLFDSRDGLTNEVIHAVVEDDSHCLWASSSYGVSRFYIRDGGVYHIECYINQDNLPNEAFMNGRVMKLDDGTIVMQALDHIVKFNPAKFQGERFGSIKLYPKLIKMLVNGNTVSDGHELDGKVILERAVSRTHEFHVNYDQNSLLLTFTGLNYLRPVQTYYKVRVKGVRGFDDWRVMSYGKSDGAVDKNGLLRLSLNGLRPGQYVIELQVSMWPETWPQEPYIWVLHVDEPWWRMTVIYLLLAIAAIALLALNFYYFSRVSKLRYIRISEEADILRRLRIFASRCEGLSAEVLSPVSDAEQSGGTMAGNLSEDFVSAMVKIVPYITGHSGERLDMTTLAGVAGMSTAKLYTTLSDHLDKNPRLLIGRMRLHRAAGLLTSTRETIEEIAEECRFVSPNYFIASFYHLYRQTPADYRATMAR